MHSVKIGEYEIGTQAPFIIAELSGNHGQDLAVAKRMIDAAAKAGAHAIKLQTYTPDSMTLDVDSPHFVIKTPYPSFREDSHSHVSPLYFLIGHLASLSLSLTLLTLIFI